MLETLMNIGIYVTAGSIGFLGIAFDILIMRCIIQDIKEKIWIRVVFTASLLIPFNFLMVVLILLIASLACTGC